MLANLKLVQIVPFIDGVVDTTTATIPNDNTAPQKTEGKEFMVHPGITPKDVSHRLLVIAQFCFHANTLFNQTNTIIAALFRDGIDDALAANWSTGNPSDTTNAGNVQAAIVLINDEVAGTTSAVTYKVRAGPEPGAQLVTFNGENSGPKFAGKMNSGIWVVEYRPN